MTDSNSRRDEGSPGDLILTALPDRLVKLRAISAPLIERGYNVLEVNNPKELREVVPQCTHPHAMVIADFHSIVGDQCDPEHPKTYAQAYREFLLSAYAPLRGMLRSESKTCDLVIVHRRRFAPAVGLGDFVSGVAEEDSRYLPTLVRWLERLASEPRRDETSRGRWVV